MLEVRDLASGYGNIQVLREVGLTVGSDEIVAVLGPNGAGKTTLLKTIVGLIRPTAGVITMEGTKISGQSTHKIGRQGLSLVPEGRMLFPLMSVEENLLMGGYLIKDRKERSKRVQDVLEMFPPIVPKLKVRSGSLSGGEQQMVAIARGLMRNPRLMMFDEPSLGLAPIIQEQILEQVQRLHELGIGVVLVEQNVELTLEIATRGYVMRTGQIVMEGTADELRASGAVHSEYMGAEEVAGFGTS
jgi:branched-chain amino acid transport system ATP-binding protein